MSTSEGAKREAAEGRREGEEGEEGEEGVCERRRRGDEKRRKKKMRERGKGRKRRRREAGRGFDLSLSLSLSLYAKSISASTCFILSSSAALLSSSPFSLCHLVNNSLLTNRIIESFSMSI